VHFVLVLAAFLFWLKTCAYHIAIPLPSFLGKFFPSFKRQRNGVAILKIDFNEKD